MPWGAPVWSPDDVKHVYLRPRVGVEGPCSKLCTHKCHYARGHPGSTLGSGSSASRRDLGRHSADPAGAPTPPAHRRPLGLTAFDLSPALPQVPSCDPQSLPTDAAIEGRDAVSGMLPHSTLALQVRCGQCSYYNCVAGCGMPRHTTYFAKEVLAWEADTSGNLPNYV